MDWGSQPYPYAQRKMLSVQLDYLVERTVLVSVKALLTNREPRKLCLQPTPLNPERKSCGFKTIRIREDGALVV